MRKIGIIFEPDQIKELLDITNELKEIIAVRIFAEKRKHFISIAFDVKKKKNKNFKEFYNIDIKGPSDFIINFENECCNKFITDLEQAFIESNAIDVLVDISIKKQNSEFHYKYKSDSYIKKDRYFLDIIFNNSSRRSKFTVFK